MPDASALRALLVEPPVHTSSSRSSRGDLFSRSASSRLQAPSHALAAERALRAFGAGQRQQVWRSETLAIDHSVQMQ
jgi:hypothetical protein